MDNPSIREDAFYLLDSLVSRPDEERTWIRLAAALLSFCERNRPSDQHWKIVHDPWSLSQEVATNVSMLLDPLGEAAALWQTYADPDLLQKLVDVTKHHIDEFQEQLQVCMVIHGAADAIGLAFWRTLDDAHFDPDGFWELEPGDVVPRVGVDLTSPKTAYITSLDGKPRREFTRTHRLALVSDNSHKFVIDYRAWNSLSQVLNDVRFLATIQPTPALGDYDIQVDIALSDPHGQVRGDLGFARGELGRLIEIDPTAITGASGRFENRGPTTNRPAISIVQQAARCGVNLALVHEYGQRGHADLDVALKSQDVRHPMLVVSGVSYDGLVEGTQRSAAHLWVLPGRQPGNSFTDAVCDVPMGSKSEPASYRLPCGSKGQTTGKVTLIESLDASDARLVLLRSPTDSLAVAICRDAMQDPIPDGLQSIGVTWLLVPAMTAKTKSISTYGIAAAIRLQGKFLLANGPATGSFADLALPRGSLSSVEARLEGPWDAELLCVAPPRNQGGTPPPTEIGFWEFDLSRPDQPNWVPASN